MNRNSLTFETLHPTKLFFRCAVPAMCSMAFSALYTMADGIFVGRYIGENALAAVNLAMPLVNVAFALADMIAVGSSVQIAMFLGEKNRDSANRIFSFSVKVIFAVSILVGLLLLFLTKPILVLIGTGEQALEYAIEYICIYALFAPVTMIYFAADNYLRICNRQRYSMILNITTAILNIILDFVLIGVFRFGVWAAAFASCISMAVGSFFSLLPFFRKKLELRFVKGKIPTKQFVRLLANGSSEFFSNISGSILSFVLNIILIDLGGTTAVAAMSIVLYTESLMGMLIFGMCDSMQPPISYCHAAGLEKRVFSLEKRVLASSAILSLVAFFFLRYGGNMIVPFFVKSGDTELLELSIQAMSLYSFSYLVNWVDGCLSSYLTAMGWAGRSFVTSICSTLLFPLLCLSILVPLLGFEGVCLMPLFAGVLGGALAIFLSIWRKKIRNFS